MYIYIYIYTYVCAHKSLYVFYYTQISNTKLALLPKFDKITKKTSPSGKRPRANCFANFSNTMLSHCNHLAKYVKYI